MYIYLFFFKCKFLSLDNFESLPNSLSQYIIQTCLSNIWKNHETVLQNAWIWLEQKLLNIWLLTWRGRHHTKSKLPGEPGREVTDGRSQMDKNPGDNEDVTFLLNISVVSPCKYIMLFSLTEGMMYKCRVEWSRLQADKIKWKYNLIWKN